MIWLTTRCWRARRRPAGSLCCTGARTWEGGGEAAAGCLLAWEQDVWYGSCTPLRQAPCLVVHGPVHQYPAKPHITFMASRRCTVPSARLSITDSTWAQHGRGLNGGSVLATEPNQPKRLVATSAAAQQPLLQSRWRDPHMQACGRQQLNAHLHAALRSDGHHQAASGGQLIHQVLRQAGRGGAHLCAARSSWQTGWGACQHHYANADAELMAVDRCT